MATEATAEDNVTDGGPRTPDGRTWVVVLFSLLLSGCSGPPGQEGHGAAVAPTPAPPLGLDYVPPEPGTYALPPIAAAADGLVVEGNSRRRLKDYMGDRYVLLSFVYTRCSLPQGCPLATSVLRMVRDESRKDPKLARSLRLISLSFDPERDTPAEMEHYARALGAGGGGAEDWVFLTTASRSDLQSILDGYGQYIVPERDENGRWTGDFSHVLKVFLIDRRGRVRQIYSTSFLHPALVINDVRTLMMEDAGG